MVDLGEHEPRRKRATQPEVAARREAARVLRPIFDSMQYWQTHFARLSAILSSRASSPAVRADAGRELSNLADHVLTCREELEVVSEGLNLAGRDSDLRKALERLSAQLEGVLRKSTNAAPTCASAPVSTENLPGGPDERQKVSLR